MCRGIELVHHFSGHIDALAVEEGPNPTGQVLISVRDVIDNDADRAWVTFGR